MAHSTDGRDQASEMPDERPRPGTQREAMEAILDQCDPGWRGDAVLPQAKYSPTQLAFRADLAREVYLQLVTDEMGDEEDVICQCQSQALAAVAVADALMVALAAPVDSTDAALARLRAGWRWTLARRQEGQP